MSTTDREADRRARWRAFAPAVGLFFLAPLVAEFLLGNLPITLLPALVVLAPMYGGGALLVRELTRRRGRGWPSIVLLAAAYAVFEEAYTTQTLFNPNYLKMNLHLLDPAYIPFLGIGGWWTVYVLTLHTVWSISTSIALAEALVPDRAVRVRGRHDDVDYPQGRPVRRVAPPIRGRGTRDRGARRGRAVVSAPNCAG